MALRLLLCCPDASPLGTTVPPVVATTLVQNERVASLQLCWAWCTPSVNGTGCLLLHQARIRLWQCLACLSDPPTAGAHRETGQETETETTTQTTLLAHQVSFHLQPGSQANRQHQ